MQISTLKCRFAEEISENMVTKEDVEKFLARFYQKVRVFGIMYRDDRNKNEQALAELGITRRMRDDVVLNLSSEDYIEGPVEDTLNHIGEMWVFGKDVKGREVYIKISLGGTNSRAICISFHVAEHKLNYLFK